MKILFILSVFFLFLVVLFYPKSVKREDLFAQVTFSVLTIMEIHTLWGYITLDYLDIGFSLSYYASYDFAFALIVLLYWIIIKGKKIQKFKITPHMWIIMSLILAITVGVGLWRYGSQLNLFAYCSADSASHLAIVEHIVEYGKIPQMSNLSGRYFLHLNEALFLKSIETFVQPMSYYRVFLIAELFFFFLSGSTFYALITKYMTNKSYVVIGILFIILYICGYPLNNLLYGYEYLGASVTIVIHIEYLLEKLMQERKIENFILLMIACFAMYHCYFLLFIGVIFGTCIFYFLHTVYYPSFWKIGLIFIGVILIIFKFQSIYAYWNLSIERLETEAIMYRDFWSNILWYVPFLIINAFSCFKEKKKFVSFGMFCGVIGTMIIFMLYMWSGKVSSYYYYKFYFLLWFLVLYNAYLGVIVLSTPKVTFAYVLFIVLVIIMTNIFNDKKISYTNDKNFGDIYSSNWKILVQNEKNMDKMKQEIFYAAAEYADKTGTIVPYIGTWEDYWGIYYYAITNQVADMVYSSQIWDIRFWYPYSEANVNHLLQEFIYNRYSAVPYIMVERNSEAYWYGIGYYSTLEVVYENEYGFIYKR